MATQTEIELFRKVIREELAPVNASLEAVKRDGAETKMKVNQIVDAMERQGYHFPKP